MVAMKTQVVHWTPTTLGPFLTLILTLTLHCEAEAAQDMQRPADEAPHFRSLIATEKQPGTRMSPHIFTRATTLGPFLTLLLTLHDRSSWIERDWWQVPATPRGAVLAARYVSR
jgi:hypothetical protein